MRVTQDPNSDSTLEMPSFALHRHGSSGSAPGYGWPTFESAAVNVSEEGSHASIRMFATDRW